MIRSGRAAVLALAGLIAVASCSSGSGGAGTAGDATVSASRTRPSPGCDRGSSQGAGATDAARTITRDGIERRYLLAVPPEIDADRSVPLVLLFHGFSSNPERFSDLTRLPAEGAAAGALVATPEGTGGQWGLDAHGADAAFVDALVDELTNTYCVDLDRVSVVGMSLGSAFAIIYACARQDEIAAIATVTVEFQLGCEEPIPIVAFHGTADPSVPYENGAVGASLPGPVRGTELNMADWAELDGCGPEPTVEQVGADVVRRRWENCRHDTDVVLYTVEGGGHAWPGAGPGSQLGHTTSEIDATSESLEFLDRHPLT